MYRLLLLFFLVMPCYADVWTLYDGNGLTPQGYYTNQAGVTCAFFNAAAMIRWNNPGGDWADAKGDAQGNAPFSTAPYVRNLSGTQIIELDAMRLISADGIVLRNGGDRVVSIASRESTTPPVLRLKLTDNTVVLRRPIADATLPFAYGSLCQATPTGKGMSMTIGKAAAVLAFSDIPANVKEAKLVLTVISSYGYGEIETYRMVTPRLGSTAAATAKATVPVSTNPGVYYSENWETDDWWSRTGGSATPSAQWTQDGGRFNFPSQGGLWFADGSSEKVPAQGTDGRVMVSRGSGYKGRGLMVVYHPYLLGYGVDVARVTLKNVIDDRSDPEPESAWLTYRVKYGKDFYGFANCEGGKAPGFSGPATICGGSGSRANGYCGWSLRQSYKLICDPKNPGFGHVVLYMYAYHGLMPGYYGANWHGNSAALLKLEEWHCVEQYVKVNTPGIADGVTQLYVDGTLALDKHNVYLRAEKPVEGYGDWRLISPTHPAPTGKRIITDKFGRQFWFAGRALDSDLGIQMARMVVHNGGVTPPGKTAQMWLDDIKVSHRRVGCD